MRPFFCCFVAGLALLQVSIADAQYGSSGTTGFGSSGSYSGGSGGTWAGTTQSTGYVTQWAISQTTLTNRTKRVVPAAEVFPNTRSAWIRHVTNHPEGVSVPYAVAVSASLADLRRYHANQHAGLHWNADTTVAGGDYSQPMVRRRSFRLLRRR